MRPGSLRAVTIRKDARYDGHKLRLMYLLGPAARDVDAGHGRLRAEAVYHQFAQQLGSIQDDLRHELRCHE